MQNKSSSAEKALTDGVQIEVSSRYISERSDPSQGQYFFAYHIRITNLGQQPLQLLRRHWIITDGFGRTEEVQGDGVIGQQPKIQPGQSFEYESYCPLTTPTGSMRGQYEMQRPDGSVFSANIPQFFLVEPGSFH